MEEISQEKAIFLPNPKGLWDTESESFIPREQCVAECQGCNKIFSDENIGDVCIAYISPKLMQRNGGCALQSNREMSVDEKKKVNPIKWSKRKNRR